MTDYRSPHRRGALGTLAIIAIVVLILLIGLGSCSVAGYNQAVGLDEAVDAQWGQVENQLQRRYDLIPNLVNTVKGLTDHESEVFTALAEARQGYFTAKDPDQRVAAAQRVEASLAKVMRLTENYPQLRSSETFLKLQDQLEGTENRLAVERGRYNEVVEAANAYRRRFPGAIYAGWAGLEKRDYFEISAEVEAAGAPQVDFGE